MSVVQWVPHATSKMAWEATVGGGRQRACFCPPGIETLGVDVVFASRRFVFGRDVEDRCGILSRSSRSRPTPINILLLRTPENFSSSDGCNTDIMLTLLFLLWSLIRGLRKPSSHTPTPAPPSPVTQSPSPEPLDLHSELSMTLSSQTRMSTESYRSRYSPFSRESSVDVGNESRHSVTSISSFSTSSRRYEIIGQRSIDSRASVTSLWSSDMSRRDSEAIPEHEVDSTDSRASFASAGSMVSSDGSRRHSEGLGRRRRSSVRSSQVRRHTRRFPLTYDRRRTTGRFVWATG